MESHHNSMMTPNSRSGLEAISSLNAKILSSAREQNQIELESVCRVALLSSGKRVIVEKHDSTKTVKKPVERSMLEILPTLSTASATQMKNHSIRFGLEEQSSMRQPWASFGTTTSMFIGGSNSSGTPTSDSKNYEDIVSLETLRAPIVDMCAIQSGDDIPAGFYRISRTPGNRKAILNSSAGGNHLYFCVRKDNNPAFAPITSFVIIFPDKNEFVPPGYFVVRRGRYPCNFNSGTNADRVYLCYKKESGANPIIDLQVIFPKHEEVPKDFSLIETSPSGIPANLNSGTTGVYGGVKLSLCYRQILSSLSCLENDSAPGPLPAPLLRQQGLRRMVANRSETDLTSLAINETTGKKFIGGTSSSASSLLLPGTVVPCSSPRPTSFPRKLSDSIPLAEDSNIVGDDDCGSSLNGSNLENGNESEVKAKTASGLFGALAGSNRTVSREVSESTELSLENGDVGGIIDAGGVDVSEFQDSGENAMWDVELDGYYENGDVDNDNGEAIDRRSAAVVDCEGNPVSRGNRRSLHAILMAIFVRHGDIALQAIQGLVTLIKDTDFFVDDLKDLPAVGTLTMMDITVESICRRFEFCQENEFEQLLPFIKALIKYSGGKLSLYCTQRLFKTFSFLCKYFSTRPGWIRSGYPLPSLDSGAELPVYRVLKEYISLIVSQVELAAVSHCIPDAARDDLFLHCCDFVSGSAAVCRRIAVGLIEDVLDNAQAADYVEMTRNLVSKHTASASSIQFWESANRIGRKVFGDIPHRITMLGLSALCKLSWQKVNMTVKGWAPRDLGIKLLALDAIAEFCLSAGEKMKASKIMGYHVRRLVVPCVMHNFPLALAEPRVLAKVMRVLSALWLSWRMHVRLEIAVLTEGFIIPILNASVHKIRPLLQMIVLQEVTTWFQQPHLLVEMFVNFDMDPSFISNRPVFSRLMEAISCIARRCALQTGAWEWKPSGSYAGPMTILEAMAKPSVAVRDVNNFAMEHLSRIVKMVMDAAGHAHLLIIDSEFRARSVSAQGAGNIGLGRSGGGKIGNGSDKLDSPLGRSNSNKSVDGSSPGSAEKPDDITAGDKKAWSKSFSSKYRAALHVDAAQNLQRAMEIYKAKGSISKAIHFLISKQYLQDTIDDIVCFLHVFKDKFDLSSMGDYLGEGGISVEENTYWSLLRVRYFKAYSFAEMELEPALRYFLTNCGFRLPGEAQKIDRFVDVFKTIYWSENHDTPYCPLRHQDTVLLLTFAIIMLNTDLHRATAGTEKKKRQKMTKDQFINNLRGADAGVSINRQYLSSIYDSIAAHPIELTVEASETKTSTTNTMQAHSSTSMSLGNSVQTISQAISAVTGGALNQTGDSSGARRRTVLNSILAVDPIVMSGDVSSAEERSLLTAIAKGVSSAEDLFRSQSRKQFSFQLTGIDTKISIDLVSFMFENVSQHLLAIVSDILGDMKYETSVSIAALNILCYAITCCIFLDFKESRLEFSHILSQFQESCIIQSRSNDPALLDTTWFQAINQNLSRTDVLENIAVIHRLIVVLKDVMQEVANAERTRVVAEKIEKKAHVLETNAYFIREGTLGRKQKHGRLEFLTTFLFSDEILLCVLVNAEYKVSEQLSLVDLSVADIADDPTGCSMFLTHPSKSFVVVADCPQSKHEWIRDTEQAIYGSKKRAQEESDKFVSGRGDRPSLIRKMSIISRLETQQEIQNNEYSRRVLVSPEPARGRSTTITPFFGGSPPYPLAISNELSSLSGDDVTGNGESSKAADLANALGIPSLMAPAVGLGFDSPLDPSTPSPALPPTPAAGVFATATNFPSSANSTSQSAELITPPNSPLVTSRSTMMTPPSSNLEIGPSASRHLLSRSQSMPLTPQEKAAKTQEAHDMLSTRLGGMDEEHLSTLFNAGNDLWKSFLDSRKSVPEEAKVKIIGLLKQARYGPATASSISQDTASSSGGNKTMSPGFGRSASHHASQIVGTGMRAGRSMSTATLNMNNSSATASSSAVSNEGQQYLTAWKDCGDMSTEEAKKRFLLELYALAPYWKYEQFI